MLAKCWVLPLGVKTKGVSSQCMCSCWIHFVGWHLLAGPNDQDYATSHHHRTSGCFHGQTLKRQEGYDQEEVQEGHVFYNEITCLLASSNLHLLQPGRRSDDEIKDCLTDIHDMKLDTTQGQKRIKDAKEMRYVMIVFLIVFRFVRLCLIAFLVQYLDLKFTLPKSGKKTRSREKNKS